MSLRIMSHQDVDTALTCEFEGVLDEVDEHLLQAARVTLQAFRHVATGGGRRPWLQQAVLLADCKGTLVRHEQVIDEGVGDLNAHGSGLWLEYAADALENFLHVERLRRKRKNASLHLLQV